MAAATKKTTTTTATARKPATGAATKRPVASAGARTSAATGSPKTTRPKSGAQATTKTGREVKGASARTTTKPGVAKASAKTTTADKKKKTPEAEPEAEAKPTSTTGEEVTIEVTIPEASEDKKEEEERPIAEIPTSSSVDVTPLADEAFTPGTANRAEQIISTETSLSRELVEELPRLSVALTGAGEGEAAEPPLEGTSVDKVDSDRLEEAVARELEREQASEDVEADRIEEEQSKEADDERAERRKVSLVCNNCHTETLPFVELLKKQTAMNNYVCVVCVFTGA